MTSSSSSIWTSSSSRMALTRPMPLLLAFVLGGLFFSRVVPSLLAFMANLMKRRKAKQQRQEQQKTLFQGRRQQQPSTKSKHDLLMESSIHVPPSGLGVLQHVAERLAGRSFQTQIRRAIEEQLLELGNTTLANNPNIRNITLQSLVTNPTPDTTPPRLRQGRMYSFPKDDDGMALDVDMEWQNCFQADFQIVTQRLGLQIPVSISNVHWEGPVRIVLTPLLEEPPGFGATLVSLPRYPNVLNYNVTVARVSLGTVPWVQEALHTALHEALVHNLVWPHRVVNPMLRVPPQPTSYYNVTTLLSADELQALEHADPLLKMQQQQQQREQESKRPQTKSSQWWRSWNRKTRATDNATTTDDTKADAVETKMQGSPKDDNNTTKSTASSSTSWNDLLDTLVRPLLHMADKTYNQSSTVLPDAIPNVMDARKLLLPHDKDNTKVDENKEAHRSDDEDDDNLFQLGQQWVDQVTQVESLSEFLALWKNDTNDNDGNDDDHGGSGASRAAPDLLESKP